MSDSEYATITEEQVARGIELNPIKMWRIGLQEMDVESLVTARSMLIHERMQLKIRESQKGYTKETWCAKPIEERRRIGKEIEEQATREIEQENNCKELIYKVEARANELEKMGKIFTELTDEDRDLTNVVVPPEILAIDLIELNSY